MEGGEDDGPGAKRICKACLATQPGGEFCVKCGGALIEIKPSEDHYLGAEVGGKYKLVAKIGQGGMGVVYKGVNEALGQRVAVKFLSRKFADDQSIVERFLNEARSYARVTHPNAVTLLDYGQHEDGALYIITEFIEGKSLTDTLKSVGPLAPDEAINVGLQVCEVLSAAHSEGVIHRDLKPDNLMLIPSTRGRYAVKVLDFGIAKMADDEGGPTTETGSVFGTPEFMSPEQARGDVADPRSDLYALGIILFYTLTGKLPFRGSNKLVVLNKQLNADPPRPSEMREGIDVPLKLEAVILKLLNKDPDARFPDADVLAEALEELKLPGGMDTGKVGVKVRSENSSPEIRLNTVRFEELTEDSVPEEDEDNPDPLGDTVAQFGEREFDESVATAAELESIEMWREHPTGESSLADADSNRFRAVALVAVVVLVAASLFVVFRAGETASDDAPAPEPVESVVATGQVLGMLAAAEEATSDGKIEEAMQSLAATEMWMDDDELPEKASERRQALRRRLDKLQTWRAQAEEALEEGRCEDAARLVGTIETKSGGLAGRLEQLVDTCRASVRASAKSPEEPEESPNAPEPTEAPVVAPPATPTRADRDSPPGEAEPPKAAAPIDGAADEPGVEEALDAFARENGEAAKPDAGAENEKPAEQVPDGMALPPRNLEE